MMVATVQAVTMAGDHRPLATLWLTDELSQSAPAYEHASLDSLAGYPSAIVAFTKH